MRLELQFSSDKQLSLPLHYQSILQGFIYSIIFDEKISDFLHNKGFKYEKRNFKAFTYSWIIGEYKIKNKQIYFSSPFTIYLSSPWEPLIRTIFDTFVNRENLLMGKNQINVESLQIITNPDFEANKNITTLSPITVYSTIKKQDGAKYTRYYEIRDPEFEKQLKSNLSKKAVAIYNMNIEEKEFAITSIGKIDNDNFKHIKYRNYLIKAWQGSFKIEGDPIFRRIAYETGLGSKNSLGFGCIDFVQ